MNSSDNHRVQRTLLDKRDPRKPSDRTGHRPDVLREYRTPDIEARHGLTPGTPGASVGGTCSACGGPRGIYFNNTLCDRCITGRGTRAQSTNAARIAAIRQGTK